MNASLYQEVVQEHMQEMEELYPRGFSFMHDILSVHTASEPDLKKQGLNFIKPPVLQTSIRLRICEVHLKEE